MRGVRRGRAYAVAPDAAVREPSASREVRVARKSRAETKPGTPQVKQQRARARMATLDGVPEALTDEERKRLDDLFALMRRVLDTHAVHEDPRRSPGGHALTEDEARQFLAQSADARVRLQRALLTWEQRATKLYALLRTDHGGGRGRAKKLLPGEFALSASQVWAPSADQLWDIAVSRCERCLGDAHAFDGFAQAIHELVRLGVVSETITDARLKKALANGGAQPGREASHALDVVAAVTGVARHKIVAACARAVGRPTAVARDAPPPPPAPTEPWERRREQNERLIAEAIERGKQRARERALQAEQSRPEPEPE